MQPPSDRNQRIAAAIALPRRAGSAGCGRAPRAASSAAGRADRVRPIGRVGAAGAMRRAASALPAPRRVNRAPSPSAGALVLRSSPADARTSCRARRTTPDDRQVLEALEPAEHPSGPLPLRAHDPSVSIISNNCANPTAQQTGAGIVPLHEFAVGGTALSSPRVRARRDDAAQRADNRSSPPWRRRPGPARRPNVRARTICRCGQTLVITSSAIQQDIVTVAFRAAVGNTTAAAR